MKKIICLFLCLGLLVCVLPLTVSAATVITRVELTLDYPVGGKTPPQNCSIHGNGYTIHSIDWEEIAGRGFLESGEMFREGYTYKATVWVKAATGYEFSYMDSNTPAITGYINGREVSVTKAYEYNAWAMVCLTVEFHNIPAKGWIKYVELSVPSPAAGESPSYTRITGTGYGTANVYFGDSTAEDMQNGIAWNPVGGDYLKPGQDTFGENTAYTFHCLVFPDEGYKIREDATVYVNGKEAEAKLDYDTFLAVAYTFPATGKTPPTHTHTPSDWRTTGIYHYKACTTCGDFLEQEDHMGGVATCVETGKCSVCGYAYIEVNENHIPDTSKWVARAHMYHFHPCTLCGAHCDIEDHRWSPTYLHQEQAGHAWICADCKATSELEKHNPGPEATETEPQTCKDCGYIITPAKNHTHELTKVEGVPATCIEEGSVEYYACSGCSDLFADAEGKDKIPDKQGLSIAALGHEISETWSTDEEYHWRTCKICAAIMDETKMLHEDSDHDGQCDTCGNSCLGEEPVIMPPTTGAEMDAEDLPKSNSWLVVVLVALTCFGAAITVAVIIIKKKQGGK